MTEKKMRLDKMLSHMGVGTRKEIKKLIKAHAITVNGKPAKDPGMHIFPHQDVVEIGGEKISYKEFIYLIMNKPAGILSATEDPHDKVVIDLLDPEYQFFEPFPVGRLDKDTEGLLLLTNDGKLAHQLLSPKKHVPKTYYARVYGIVSDEDISAFKQGVTLDDGYVTMPGNLKILAAGPISEIELTIYEGKFHQVKRMFQAVGKQVIYLKRIALGSLELDPNLSLGTYRELNSNELDLLRKDAGLKN